jgi:hypothetical protein
MRYCNKTKDIIHSSYKTLSLNEIRDLLLDNNLRDRTEDNLQLYVSKLVIRDTIREERRKKFEKVALQNPIKYRASTLLKGAKSRAKQKNIPCDLTVEWIEERLIQGKCEVTEIEFVIKQYGKREDYETVHPHAPSLDQISPSKGYTMDNVQVVVDHFNKMKNDRDLETTVYLARRLLQAYDRRKVDVLG